MALERQTDTVVITLTVHPERSDAADDHETARALRLFVRAGARPNDAARTKQVGLSRAALRDVLQAFARHDFFTLADRFHVARTQLPKTDPSAQSEPWPPPGVRRPRVELDVTLVGHEWEEHWSRRWFDGEALAPIHVLHGALEPWAAEFAWELVDAWPTGPSGKQRIRDIFECTAHDDQCVRDADALTSCTDTPLPAEHLACGADSECEAIVTPPCALAAAVRSDKVEDARARLIRGCGTIVCSNRAQAARAAVCRAGTCRLAAPRR